MKNKFYTYALVKALYDQNTDYFDTFLALVLNVVPEDKFVYLIQIQQGLQNKYDLTIPLHVIKTICQRGKSKQYLEPKESTREYRITTKGIEFLGNQESAQDIERRINSFITDLSNFFKSKGRNLTIEETRSLLDTFIKENLEGLVDFINPKEQLTIEFPKKIGKEDTAIFISYIKEAQQSKPTEYKQLQEMIHGSIISTILSVEGSSDISDMKSRSFKKSIIFFDTNFIFSLLGFHSEEKLKAAEELYSLLKKIGFKLQIFDFTVDEICRVVNGYIQNKNRFPSTLPIDSVYSFLKRKRWGLTDVSEFINNIDDTLYKKGIHIYPTDIVDLQHYTSPHNESIRPDIAKTKVYDLKNLSTNHDLAAIDKVRDLRKHAIRRVEDAEAFFLTSDYSLQKAVLLAMGHTEKGTLSEVILDRVLTNIVWLKNPDADISLNTIIATHSRDLLIDRRVWEKFYSIIDKLKKEGEVSDEQIEALFYHNNISSILNEFDRSNIDKVDEKLALEAIEEAVKEISVEKKTLIEQKEFTEGELFKTQTEKEKSEQTHNEEIARIKKVFRSDAGRNSAIICYSILIISTLAIWALEYYIFLKINDRLPQKHIQMIAVFYSGIGITITGGAPAIIYKILNQYCRGKIEIFFINRYMKKYMLKNEQKA